MSNAVQKAYCSTVGNATDFDTFFTLIFYSYGTRFLTIVQHIVMFKAYGQLRTVLFLRQPFCCDFDTYLSNQEILCFYFLIKPVEVNCCQIPQRITSTYACSAFAFCDISVFLRFCETLLFVWFTATSANMWYNKKVFYYTSLVLKSFTWW